MVAGLPALIQFGRERRAMAAGWRVRGRTSAPQLRGLFGTAFPEYIPKTDPVKNAEKSEQAESLKRWAYLTPPAPHGTSLATLRHSLGLSALMITEQAYAGTRRCGSAIDR